MAYFSLHHFIIHHLTMIAFSLMVDEASLREDDAMIEEDAPENPNVRLSAKKASMLQVVAPANLCEGFTFVAETLGHRFTVAVVR